MRNACYAADSDSYNYISNGLLLILIHSERAQFWLSKTNQILNNSRGAYLALPLHVLQETCDDWTLYVGFQPSCCDLSLSTFVSVLLILSYRMLRACLCVFIFVYLCNVIYLLLDTVKMKIFTDFSNQIFTLAKSFLSSFIRFVFRLLSPNASKARWQKASSWSETVNSTQLS